MKYDNPSHKNECINTIPKNRKINVGGKSRKKEFYIKCSYFYCDFIKDVYILIVITLLIRTCKERDIYLNL